MTGHIFLSWTAQNGRTRDLAADIGAEPFFVNRPGAFGLVGRYARQFVETYKIVRKAKPASVILMLPPAPALVAVLLSAPKTTRLVFDLHTGFFDDPKWSWAAKLSMRAMRHRGFGIVTNEALQRRCAAVGLASLILHDRIVDRGVVAAPESFVLCPLSYANDEPVAEILQAAERLPEVRWVFTGKAPEGVRASAPGNVEFTGFVDDETFDRLVRTAAGVAALTTRPHTMQRAGYEALMAGTAQVTSDFPELRDFLSDAAVYVEPSGTSIANGVTEMLARREQLIAALVEVRTRRMVEQAEALSDLRARLAGH